MNLSSRLGGTSLSFRRALLGALRSVVFPKVGLLCLNLLEAAFNWLRATARRSERLFATVEGRYASNTAMLSHTVAIGQKR